MAKVLNKFLITRPSPENKNIGLVFGQQLLKFAPTQNPLEETIQLDEFIDEATSWDCKVSFRWWRLYVAKRI